MLAFLTGGNWVVVAILWISLVLVLALVYFGFKRNGRDWQGGSTIAVLALCLVVASIFMPLMLNTDNTYKAEAYQKVIDDFAASDGLHLSKDDISWGSTADEGYIWVSVDNSANPTCRVLLPIVRHSIAGHSDKRWDTGSWVKTADGKQIFDAYTINFALHQLGQSASDRCKRGS